MLVTFTSLFDIYPDKLRKGAVVGFTKPDGSMLKFPCTLDTGDAVKDVNGRWIASALGFKPVIAKYTGALERTKTVEAWIGDGFRENPKAKFPIANQTLEHVRFVDGVTEIGKGAFRGCTGLTSITIPSSVTAIGDLAFNGCFGLTSIMIPEGVTSIGYGAFSWCVALADITIPKTIEKIGGHAFLHCKLTSITIPDGVTYIGREAFSNCCYLTSITIPESVTSIGDFAFYNCTGLTSITIPAGVTQIECNAFDGCTGIESFNVDENNRVYTSVDGVLMNKEKTAIIRYPIGKSDFGYVVPNGVAHIADHAFSGCGSLSSVTISEGVTSIGNCAFGSCESLTSITIPSSVMKIGFWAFDGCTGLTSITIPPALWKSETVRSWVIPA